VTLPTASNDNFSILIGDCRERLRELPDGSVHCVVTSPPYFGLRFYGHEGQIGLEATPDEFVAQMVEVFREVRRVLRDDGTLWLNLGDSYASVGGCGAQQGQMKGRAHGEAARSARFSGEGVKVKELIGIPWRVAFALQADGWYLRQDIIWSKPNPMPESVRDRCTKSHEYVFMLTKSPRYFFDHEAIKEPEVCGRKRGLALHPDTKSTNGNGGLSRRESNGMRNRRSVWTVTTKPFKGAHFATFPPDLIEPCILAGCPSSGTVLDPFGGSGTTAGVALAHGRQAILCELNPAYAEMVPDRIASILDRYGKPWPSNDNAIDDPEIELLIG
jgi:DNA modification methylase